MSPAKLTLMADDVSIAADTAFRWYAELLQQGRLNKAQLRQIEQRYRQAEKLITALLRLNDDLPDWTPEEYRRMYR